MKLGNKDIGWGLRHGEKSMKMTIELMFKELDLEKTSDNDRMTGFMVGMLATLVSSIYLNEQPDFAKKAELMIDHAIEIGIEDAAKFRAERNKK